MTDTLAIVVVTWNSAGVIGGLLDSLDEGLAGLSWHITIADNASADKTLDLVREMRPDARIVQTGYNAGYAAAFNSGLKDAPPYTAALILNADIRLTPGCVKSLLDELNHPGTGIAVPQIIDAHGDVVRSRRRTPTLVRALGEATLGQWGGRFGTLGETVTADEAYAVAGPTDWATGAAMLMSKECLDRSGPWDESFFLYSEETEFCLRAKDHGFATRYTPASVIHHLEGDSKISPRLYTLLTVNRVRLYRLRHRTPAATAYWAVIVCREAARSALGKERSRHAIRALLRPGTLRAKQSPDTLAGF